MRDHPPQDARRAAVPCRVQRLAGEAVRVVAPAKINLNLLVGRRRPDGYHPLDSLVVRVALFDRLTLRPREDGDIALNCSGADCGPAEQNLALRAARLVAEQRQGSEGVDVHLAKVIPPGRGLGGGSSDAAACLLGLDALWGLGVGPEELADLAGRLGSDVPLFLGPPAARMTGRGERLQAVRVHPFVAVLFLPPFACATAEVYRQFDTQRSAPPDQIDPSVLSAPPSQWRHLLRNQLAAGAGRACPALGRLYDALASALPVPVHLTGSGSGLFALCDDEAEARSIVAAAPADLRPLGRLVRPCPW
jgi:4-diphosphocytidyl-2-C-methyl-D-erythritol kinase